MIWIRMILVAFRLVWPFLLTPWRSPLLRWRMETYGVLDERGRLLHAGDISPARFFRFTLHHHRSLLAFLHWAARL